MFNKFKSTTQIFLTAFLLSLHSTLLNAQSGKSGSFYFIAFGDMPYVLPQDYARFDNVINAINDMHPAFTLNVGDFKASSTPCSNEAFATMLTYYDKFNEPMVYTPGDNEWTDCTKKEAGAYDAEERLITLRKMFFKDRMSFGKQKITLSSEAQNELYAKFVENNYWSYQGISFATLHVVGSNNNFLSNAKDGNKEFFDRDKANLWWLEETFKKAKAEDAKAVVLVMQADMFLGAKDLREASGFNALKKKITELSTAFQKPVLLINGDSHDFVVEKPIIADKVTKKCLENFTRLQVPGESNMNAVKVYVNPSSPSVFMFEEIHVKGNE